MGWLQSFLRLWRGGPRENPYRRVRDESQPSAGPDPRGLAGLAGRLGVRVDELRSIRRKYHRFTIPKRSGGRRQISAPCDELKVMQRRILRRLLGRLRAHPAAKGFERGESVVTNALPHTMQDVVIRMDLKEFFPSTSAKRVTDYFRRIGWDKKSAALLTELCTHDGGLPQGAPTSPRLSNLVNYQLDARLAGLAALFGGAYTRYADDLTFSLPLPNRGDQNSLVGSTKAVLRDYGYTLHQDKKFRIARDHHRQVVTGLVVNQRVNLPRHVRRRLRAIRHHLATGRPATLTPEQLAGWLAYQNMVETQSRAPGE